MTRAFLVLALMLPGLSKALPAQHTADAPGVLEGPQTPGTAPARAAEPALMNNDSVLRMHAAGLSDELILQTIAAQPGIYETGPDTLIALKGAGLSDAVLTAMGNKARHQITNLPNPAAPPPPVTLSEVNEIGVYYKDKQGRWTMMETEPVHARSSGWIKNTLSDGIIKQDMNGKVNGPQAKLALQRPVEFLLYTQDGVSPGEYTLLQFRLNGKDREFRTLTGGVFHSESGAKHDEVAFTATRTAPHTYVFKLDKEVGGGEFGILPPGTGNVTNGGKVYTFAITE